MDIVPGGGAWLDRFISGWLLVALIVFVVALIVGNRIWQVRDRRRQRDRRGRAAN